MRELKSIEKLQTLIKDNSDGNHIDIRGVEAEFETELFRIIGELQAEINERFMELPVDADGVPIRVGDTITYSDSEFTVRSIADDYVHAGGIDLFAHVMHHVKPRTVEDVLREYGDAVDRLGQANVDMASYADEIRELLGGDA